MSLHFISIILTNSFDYGTFEFFNVRVDPPPVKRKLSPLLVFYPFPVPQKLQEKLRVTIYRASICAATQWCSLCPDIIEDSKS
ncbi:hypothetical protein Gasu2_39610 [Galdieria sulphuraria]|uniref:Uncharacterized protein n=1 Tax=Galdieria sulphuraria TaxID=130081 RepID=M2Y8A1_GALSU|nr:uncharacterized protein Gasu_07010 [Galdieria sulphuraria]EME32293.1 hypothetical protein Gasu_07010 [Galdieria sulphuraria]GJD09728.1 hypothetical protein Gasu2_39610 [Galdieria sulphuraria]|eukprot:XP_005708813.1 hypothetical protein Gasu_07010 [Galdieria sulphuraria]